MSDSQLQTPGRQTVLVISSHVVRGSVGNRAIVFALETLGHPVWALPTVVLPWHPGHGPATRATLPAGEFSAIVDDLCRAPWLGEVGAVLSGYLGNDAQAHDVARLVTAVRERNADALYVCDPVIGDKSGLYVPEDTARAIRDELLPIASVATPNRYELEWIAGTAFADNAAIVEAARSLAPERVLVTTAFAMMGNSTGNLLVTGKDAFLAEHQAIPDPPNGPGDLLSALFLSRLLGGGNDERALEKATASVFEILARTAKHGADELTLERETASLVRPFAPVQMRRIARPAKPQKTKNKE
ncbi:pyridoxal kinase PdxY [Hoeflea poritis]|uniref:pyridoxal kinase n=1 Tax=Hoeflea poritis TaxID=2993659 RepID=A0ABT4VKZ0_9HYPH|nr:pyridoxal kinase PdxY [Hoeflea poritis]MDA4845383.1 pyridoxal kinase PdxY [Hoeflea poritis]